VAQKLGNWVNFLFISSSQGAKNEPSISVGNVAARFLVSLFFNEDFIINLLQKRAAKKLQKKLFNIWQS